MEVLYNVDANNKIWHNCKCCLQNIFNEGEGLSCMQQYEQFAQRLKLLELKLPYVSQENIFATLSTFAEKLSLSVASCKICTVISPNSLLYITFEADIYENLMIQQNFVRKVKREEPHS